MDMKREHLRTVEGCLLEESKEQALAFGVPCLPSGYSRSEPIIRCGSHPRSVSIITGVRSSHVTEREAVSALHLDSTGRD